MIQVCKYGNVEWGCVWDFVESSKGWDIVVQIPIIPHQHMIDSYLERRVVVSWSASILLEQGYPQGSVLGPCSGTSGTTLSLPNSKRFQERPRSITCYADDTAFVISAANENQLIRQIQIISRETIKLVRVAGLWHSLPKTEVIVGNGLAFGRRKPEILQFPL